MKQLMTARLTALLLTPLIAMCVAAESSQPIAQGEQQ